MKVLRFVRLVFIIVITSLSLAACNEDSNSTAPIFYIDSSLEEGLIPTYAYSYNNQHFYGSALFTYVPDENDGGNDNSAKQGDYIVRVSGYANFALQPLPVNGDIGNITGIYTKYSSKDGRYPVYQLLINKFDDIEFSK